jgi:chemotaxis protein CheD
MGIINLKPQAPHLAARVSGKGPNPLPGERQRAYLLPGQFHVSAEPCQIKTILGSCVSICLWDSRRAVGGMNHFLLPSSGEGQPVSLRFGDMATAALLEKLLWVGGRVENLTAKVFGGAAIFQNQNRYAVSLGARNVAAALELLKNAGIPVVAQQTGGSHGRKLIFNTDDGAAWSKRV